MLLMHKALPRLLFTLASLFASAGAQAEYQLEKVVEVSRHGVRPPTAGNREAIEAATHRPWPVWTTHDGELTGHGYAAAVLKGRYEADYYRQHGLLPMGCPNASDVYVRASPLQRTKATAEALLDGAFPGCGIAIHHVEGKADPLFQIDKMGLAPLDAAKAQAGILQAMGGSIEKAQQRLQPEISLLRAAVCLPTQPCSGFDQPWHIKQGKDGRFSITGLGTLSNMAETIRLAYSNNLPQDQVAFDHAQNAKQTGALMPLLTERYAFTNDVPYIAQRGGSLLLDQIALALRLQPGQHRVTVPDTRWLLYVAHDTNIAYLRTLLGFSWQMDVYPRGNIPPAGSLIFERWHDSDSGKRFLRIYFQAQSLDQLRRLTPLNASTPPLKTEFSQPDCRLTPVGVLCPYEQAMQRITQAIDRSAIKGEVRY